MAETTALAGRLAERADNLPAVNDGHPPTIAELINRQRGEIARALPAHLNADRLARIATTVIRTTPKLMECTAESLLGALMLSAQTGLEPGPLGHAYFVPYGNECQWILGYRGLIELARRSGKLDTIEARVVHERDEFDFAYGLEETLVHRPAMDGDPGPVVAAWGMAKFKDGGHYFVVLSRADIDEHRKRSQTGRNNRGPWASDFDAMARKTVIRVMAPYLPLSAEQASALTYDETVNTAVQVDVSEPADTAWIDAPSAPALESSTGDGEAPTVAPSEPPALPAEGDGMTAAQSRAMHALLKEKRGAAGDDRFPVLAEILGRPFATTKQLTKADASTVIDFLQDGAVEDVPDDEAAF